MTDSPNEPGGVRCPDLSCTFDGGSLCIRCGFPHGFSERAPTTKPEAGDYANTVWGEALAAHEEGGDPVAVIRAGLDTVEPSVPEGMRERAVRRADQYAIDSEWEWFSWKERVALRGEFADFAQSEVTRTLDKLREGVGEWGRDQMVPAWRFLALIDKAKP